MIVLRKLNIFMFLTFLLFGIEPREHPLPLKISVIVPVIRPTSLFWILFRFREAHECLNIPA